ncbi:hypothetical protein SAMN05421766_101595 [Zobellia uliginosa]|uniref:Uncharacterized protein n=1 Tax=Zobellia uliginosa TaxID=143224 RepID=A0ABY1KMJ2_9FLAO|nr:hypothetical protein SAMN05421766_101595 [Zobellia uliginosa]
MNVCDEKTSKGAENFFNPWQLFFLVSVSSPTLLAFMGSHLMSFSFFTARHKILLLVSIFI